jgi:hypothetical protein
MLKLVSSLVIVGLLGLTQLQAKDDAPRGFDPISEIAKAKDEAVKKKQLLVVAVKGADDTCPHCANAMETGEKVVGSASVKVFARAEALNTADTSSYPLALKDRAAKKFTTGAWVEYLVFNSDGTQLLATATRFDLDNNEKATSAFKKQVSEAKKGLK